MAKQSTTLTLNGGWVLLFKVVLVGFTVLTPPTMAWGVWVTSETFINREFRNRGDRFTDLNGAELRADIEKNRKVDAEAVRVQLLSAKDLDERIRKLDESLTSIKEILEKMQGATN